jgi:phosphopantetheinyl transferase
MTDNTQIAPKRPQISVYYWRRIHADTIIDDHLVVTSLLSMHGRGSEFASSPDTIPQGYLIRRGKYGKPALTDISGISSISPMVRYNVSHSHEVAMMAVSSSLEVGIDVERISPTRRYLEMAEYAFSPAEFDALAKLPNTEIPRAFTAVWTRKEAVVKAIGGSAAILLDRFNVSADPRRGSGVAVITDDISSGSPTLDISHREVEKKYITYHDLPFGREYRATLAWAGRETYPRVGFHRVPVVIENGPIFMR